MKTREPIGFRSAVTVATALHVIEGIIAAMKRLLGIAGLMLAVGPSSAAVLVEFTADRGVSTALDNTVTAWVDQSGNGNDASPLPQGPAGPVLATALVNGKSRPVLRFNGSSLLVAAPHVPARGTLFLVLSNMVSSDDRRVIGWEDSCCGAHGIGIAPSFWGDGLLAIARNYYWAGDIWMQPSVQNMEVLTLSWGNEGVTLERRLANGEVLSAPSNGGINVVTDGGSSLHIGSAGDFPLSYTGLFQGDIAALQIYDEQLSASDRAAIASNLSAYWLGVRSIGTPGTVTFSSGPDWKAFSKDPGPTSFGRGDGFIGPAQAVCLNDWSPWPCPDNALRYGYPGWGWFADLSRIPSARWIWAPHITGDTTPSGFASYFFSRTFILDGRPTRGEIYIAVDDFAEVLVNGSLVGTIGSMTEMWIAGEAQSYLHWFDISGFLKPGRNVITIHAQNAYWGGCDPCSYSESPAGVVFGGSMSFAP